MDTIINNLCLFLINNIDKKISMNDIEKEFNYNKYYLIRLFKEYTGLTITEYINYIKSYKSINSLINSDDTILKIALTYGFNSQEYYSEVFKGVIGIPPLKFRK